MMFTCTFLAAHGTGQTPSFHDSFCFPPYVKYVLADIERHDFYAVPNICLSPFNPV